MVDLITYIGGFTIKKGVKQFMIGTLAALMLFGGLFASMPL